MRLPPVLERDMIEKLVLWNRGPPDPQPDTLTSAHQVIDF